MKLRAFAKMWLAHPGLKPKRTHIWTPFAGHPLEGQLGLTAVLWREGELQVELVVGLAGSSAPSHRHNRCESADTLIAGDITGLIAGRRFGSDLVRGDNLAANLQFIPRGAWHEGATKGGVVLLSFQRWQGQPDFIANDWESADV